MEHEIAELEGEMKEELKGVKDKYVILKADVKNKYKEMEKQKKKQEKEETKKLRKSIPKSLKILVWDKNIGKEKGIGECDVCNSEIDSKNFECGHVKSVKDGGETNIENLLPICSSCNKSMGTQNLLEFKEKYFKNQNVKKENETKEKKKNETHVEKFIQQKLRKTDKMNYMKVGGFECMQLGKIPMFLSLDNIYSMYRDWLNENYIEHYETTKCNSFLGEEPPEKNELKEKLIKVFGEYTIDPNPKPIRQTNYNDFGYNNNSDPMNDFLSEKGYGFVKVCFA